VWLGGGVLGILGIPGTGHPDADADADSATGGCGGFTFCGPPLGHKI